MVQTANRSRACFVKFNTDVSFSVKENKVGIGMCLWDDADNFIRVGTPWFSPITDVPLGETMCLLLAIQWVRELGLKDVIIKLDAKMVVDAFNSKNTDIFEFGCLIKVCKSFFLTFFSHNIHVEFTRRNANMVVHSQAGVALFTVSPHEHFDIPSCISSLIMNEIH